MFVSDSSTKSSGSGSSESESVEQLKENNDSEKSGVRYNTNDKKRPSQVTVAIAKKLRKMSKELKTLTKDLSNGSSESEDSEDSDGEYFESDARNKYSRQPYFELMDDLLQYVTKNKKVDSKSLLQIAEVGVKHDFLMIFLVLHCNFDVEKLQFRDEASRKRFGTVVDMFQPHETCRVLHGIVPATYRPKKVTWKRNLVPPCCFYP
ncbi:hypothetical protein CYMTET_13568 [Cymbomonas tetramitiformis]|uniref:Uncharacterized protein n=1 Tax=Cymbomonas tetramitiformis TaxID=36881 RepID=A0AAE0LAR8_9CHLO|nr:hypothetical protein CYMTET_13568 [Cymbomonas tetramitiformis]|eukprot:gene876-1371_t